MENKFNVTVVARIKHGRLYEAIKEKGWTMKQAAEFLGVNPSKLSAMVNLREKPPFIFNKHYLQNPKRKKRADELTEKLMELTGQTVEDLFPESVMTEEFLTRSKKIEANKDISTAALLGYAQTLALPPAPDEVLMQEEAEEEIQELIEELGPERRHAFERVCIDGLTQKEAGRERGVGPGAISLLIQSAIEEIEEKIVVRKNRDEIANLVRVRLSRRG